MKPIARILAYLKYFPWQIGFNVLFNILHILFNLGSYVMIVPFVELLFGLNDVPTEMPALTFSQESIANWAFWHLAQYRDAIGVWHCLLYIGAGYLACSFLSNMFRYLAMFFLASIRNGLIERFRNDLYHHITILPVGYFTKQRRGDLISRMANDLTDVEWSVVSTLQSLVKDPLNILIFSATLLFVSWRLFLLFLVVLPIGVWLIARIGASLKRNSQLGQTMLGRLFSTLEENLSAIRIVKIFGAEEMQGATFAESNDSYTATMQRVARRRELSSPLSEILGTIALVIILIVGGSWVIGGHIMPSVFIFFVIVFARLIPPIQAVVRAYNSLQKGSASAARFLEVLDADEVIVEQKNAVKIDTFADKIELRDVSFHFGDGIPILQHIDLDIPQGINLAIVGPSGAGKSTLVDLLPRFYDPIEGAILFDGHDLHSLNINSLRRQFGLVSQDCILFNDTVTNNISLGSPRYTQQQIQQAAIMAGADDFIQKLPKGYNTTVGDRGLTLSGGQRQRISIARALLRNTPILILDEATSALDSETEHLLQTQLNTLAQGRTIITIAHRLATIRHADHIIVLDHGRIVQRGTHEQLVATDGLYRKLVEMQSFD